MGTLQIIVGSSRPTRQADRVLAWVERRAREHGSWTVEVLDLRDWPLPLFQEHRGTIGDPADPSYSDPVVRRWNRKIAEGDAYVFVTPEYTYSIPAVLKNAIDSVFLSWAFRNKPAAFVSYSADVAAGARAAAHLALVSIEAELVPLRNSVAVPRVADAFDDANVPRDALLESRLGVLLDDLAWWTNVLARARGAGELPPAMLRQPA